MYSRLKEMEQHYKQLDEHWKKKFDDVFIQLDDIIEDVLLEQEYEGGSGFIRHYRKTNSLRDLKRKGRNRVVRINSRLGGIVTEVNHEAERRNLEMKTEFKRRNHIAEVKKQTKGLY
ncbi:hypothetical protein RRK80_004698 [Salmonella enterica]|nr:hypothetical protein [Salmonella enterica]